MVRSLVDLPCSMICEKCLPTERIMAANIFDADLSGDEGIFEEDDLECLAAA